MSLAAVESVLITKQNRSSEELEMRNLIVPKLRVKWPDARIVHELPLRYSSNRIDLAAIRPTEIISVEIKSSKDVADRLERQLRAFLPISSQIIVALAPKWNEELAVKESKFRGVTSYDRQYTSVHKIIRNVNHGHNCIETWTVDVKEKIVDTADIAYRQNNRPWLSQMLHMLHVEELEGIARQHRICVGKRPNHKTLYEECSDLMTGREIVSAVCGALRARNAFAKESDDPITGETR